MKISTQNKIPESNLVADIKHLIIDTKQRVANVANAGITMLYWHIGERINRDVLGNQRAEYGKQIIATLAQQLKAEFGRGYDEKSLRRMMQFATLFQTNKLSRHWRHNYHGLISWRLCHSKMKYKGNFISQWHQRRDGQKGL